MTKEKYKEDLREIKEIMRNSSKFISLSGMSGVLAGVFGLAGAYFAYQTVYQGENYLGYQQTYINNETLLQLLGIAIGVIVLTFVFGIYFTRRKAKENNQGLWDTQTKRLLTNFLIPMFTGGILCFMLLLKGFIGLVAPFTLIFYGLALVNASKYTLPQVKSLGILEITLGLAATHFIGYSLLIWALGFGVLHIIYGVIMQAKG